MSLVEQAPANSHTSNEETANQTINMIRNIREHIQNDGCQCCKKILIDIFVQKETVTDFSDGKSTKSVTANFCKDCVSKFEDESKRE